MTTISDDLRSDTAAGDTPAAATPPHAAGAGARQRFRIARRLLSNRTFVISGAIVLLFLLAAIFAPLLARHDPEQLNTQSLLQGPSGEFWLGTDSLGRDIYSRLLFGAGVTLRAAALAVGVAVVIGIPLGFLAGYVRGVVDTVLSTINDTLMSMPGLLFALSIIAALGPGLTNAMIAVGLIQAPGFFRISRAAATSVRKATYVEAARSLGCSGTRVVLRHVLPNTSGPLLVVASFGFSVSIVSEATLSFLGLGVQPPGASWGTLTNQAFQSVRYSSWGIVPPVVAITVLVVAIALMADTLQEAIGVQRRGS